MEELLLAEINRLERGSCLFEILALHKRLKKEQRTEYKKIVSRYHDTDSILQALGDNTLYWLLEDAICEIIRWVTTSYNRDLLRGYLWQRRA